MAINLQKGQKIDLTKGNTGLSEILVGLGWDPVAQNSGGFFAKLFGGGAQDIDCDASVLMLNENDKLVNKSNLIYFGNLKSGCGSIRHTGDNLTGDGDGDDEEIIVKLKNLPTTVHKLVFVVNIYDCINRKQHFGMIQNAYIRLVNMANKQELVRFNLSEDHSGKTALFAGEIYRYGEEWKFAATGQGTQDSGLSEIIRRY